MCELITYFKKKININNIIIYIYHFRFIYLLSLFMKRLLAIT